MQDISNENAMSQDSALRTSFKTAVAGTVLFGSIVGLYVLGITLLERVGGGGLNSRTLSMIEYLPEIAAAPPERRLVMVFGSSMVQRGFDPLVFDAQMAAEGLPVTSYNYGLGNLNPRFQRILTRRIREAFERDERRLALALVEFNPFQTTVRRNESTRITDEQNIAILSTPAELWRRTLADPSSGARMFVIRYFRKGYSAELLTSLPQLIGAGVDPAIAASAEYQAAERRRAAATRRFQTSLAQDDYPPSAMPGWDPALRGGQANLALVSPETRAALAEAQAAQLHPLLMRLDLQERIDTADILGLGFDETLIAAFIEMVRDFQAIADTVEVVLLPRNAEYVVYTPDVQARLDALKRRIADETGAAVRDHQRLEGIETRHFADSTHLNSVGIDTYTRALAADYAGVLREAR